MKLNIFSLLQKYLDNVSDQDITPLFQKIRILKENMVKRIANLIYQMKNQSYQI